MMRQIKAYDMEKDIEQFGCDRFCRSGAIRILDPNEVNASNEMVGKRGQIFLSTRNYGKLHTYRETTFRSTEAGQNIHLNAGQGPRGQLVYPKVFRDIDMI